MGGALRRGVKNFNVENRAHRLIDKQKLPKAPRPPTMVKKMKELEKGAGQSVAEIQDRLHRKDERLLGMLRDVRVESTDPVPKSPDGEPAVVPINSKSKRHLPQDRKPVPEPSSILESQNLEIVPPGRLSVFMAQELLVRNKQNPKEYNAERLAADYKLDLEDTRNILEYFKTLKVVPLISEEAAERLKEEQVEAEALSQLLQKKIPDGKS